MIVEGAAEDWKRCRALVGAVRCGKCERVVPPGNEYMYTESKDGRVELIRCMPCIGYKDPLFDLFGGMFGGKA